MSETSSADEARGRAAVYAALDDAGVRRGSARSVGLSDVAAKMGMGDQAALCARIGRGDIDATVVAARVALRLEELSDDEIRERAGHGVAASVAVLLASHGPLDPPSERSVPTDDSPAGATDPLAAAPPTHDAPPSPSEAPAPVTGEEPDPDGPLSPAEDPLSPGDDEPPLRIRIAREPGPRPVAAARVVDPDVERPAPVAPPPRPPGGRRLMLTGICAALAGAGLAVFIQATLLAPDTTSVVGVTQGRITAASVSDGAIGADALAEESVTSRALAPESVSANAVAPGAIGAPDRLGAEVVTPPALAPGAVGTEALAPGAVDRTRLAPALRTQLGRSTVPETVLRRAQFTGVVGTVSCNAGETALAGGGEARAPLVVNAPVGEAGQAARGWQVRLVATARPAVQAGTVWVVCQVPPPAGG